MSVMSAGRIIGIAAFALWLAGCAAPAASSKGHALQTISGADAFHSANKVCNAYGRAATVVAYDGTARQLTFRCIEP
jgi:hypothetical protein